MEVTKHVAHLGVRFYRVGVVDLTLVLHRSASFLSASCTREVHESDKNG